MEQFRQIGEVVGSLKALMVMKHDIPINQRQCCLLLDMYVFAFETISDEIRQNLRLDERSIKWKALEYPMKELHKIIKEGEQYIKYCLDTKDWWGKALSLHLNRDCVEFHIHNLLCCFPVVIEAIETAAEISGLDEEIMLKKRYALMEKYDTEWSDPKLFQWMFGKQYLVPREICSRLDSAWKEDRWFLLETIREKKNAVSATLAKHEQRLGDLLLKKLNGSEPASTKLLPSSVLVGASDYQVKRRLGLGVGHFKEIQWLGESFALRTFYGEIEPLIPEINTVLSLSHPNTLQHFCGFYDEERKEGFLVMELMYKNLDTYIKENCGQRKRVPFSLPVAVDIMLQIARGMEYLHSKKMYHGDLNPSNILIKPRNGSAEGYFFAKVTGFGLTSIKNYTFRSSPKGNGVDPVIWYAPEVLAEQEQPDGKCNAKYTEKADIYSFGMLCFELLTGKIPFEDGHLQGEKMVRNIRAGGRPLFPFPSPKYLANLTRKCWQSNPSLRPSFSALCRILRYIKKILIINPDHGQPESPPPLVDYCDIEAGYSRRVPGEESTDLAPVSQIPFQLFAYRLVEKEKISGNSKDKTWDIGNEGSSAHRPVSLCDDEHLAIMDDLLFVPSDRRSVYSEIIESKNPGLAADQRSAVSEIPHQKHFEFDQRSFGSESPRTRFQSATTTNQRSPGPVILERTLSLRKAASAADLSSSRPGTPGLITPERKFSLTRATSAAAELSSPRPVTTDKLTLSASTEPKKKSVEIPEETLPSMADHTLASPKPPQANPLTTATAELNIVTAQVAEKKHSATDQKVVDMGSLARKNSYRIRRTKKLSDIPEIKDLAATITEEKSLSSKNSRKKTSSNDKRVHKSGLPKSSEKKDFIKVKEKEKEKPKSTKPIADSQGTSREISARSSPARMARTSLSAASSPARTPKEISSSRYSSSFAMKGYLSPRQSPLNPCTRCTRGNRDSPLHPHM